MYMYTQVTGNFGTPVLYTERVLHRIPGTNMIYLGYIHYFVLL